MFKQKVLVIALMAVVLLSSFVDGRFNIDTRMKRKFRAAVESGITAVDRELRQAGLMFGAAVGQNDEQAYLKRRQRPKAEVVPGSTAAFDLTSLQSSTDTLRRRQVKPRRM